MAIMPTRYIHDYPLPYCLSLFIERDFGYLQLMDKLSSRRRLLCEHPFRLDTPVGDRRSGAGEIDYYGGISSSDSALAMKANILFVLSGVRRECLLKTRIIYAQCDARQPNHHAVFCEIWTDMGVVISGEYSDCSGAGGKAASDILGMFKVLELTHGIVPEKVEIPYRETLIFGERFNYNYGIRLL